MKRLLTSMMFCLTLLLALSVMPALAQMGAPESSSGVVGPTSGKHIASSSSVAPSAHRFAAGSTTGKSERKATSLTGAPSKSKSHKLAGVGNSKSKKSLHKKRTPAKKSPHAKKRIGMV